MYSHFMTTSALIIGGGIAGPVTAMAMQRAGLDPVVYEAHDHGAEGVGAFLTLATNGLEGLHLLDLDHRVADIGMATRRMRIVSGTGKPLAEFDNGGLTSFGTPSRTLRRADLYRTLRDEALRRGVRIEYGKQLEDARIDGDRVRAEFADGTSAEGDLLVGADGLRSRTRAILDPQAPDPRYLGLLNTGGFATGLSLDGEPGAAHFVFGTRCFFGYLIHPGGDVWWFANPGRRVEPTAAELASITPEQQRTELIDLFSGDAGPALQIIDATDSIIRSWSTYDLPTVPTWRNERMVIIGDAAHATSPSSGQGASMAIEDAIVLARCLRDSPDITVALAAYETARRARVERIVAQGKRNGSGKAPGPVGRVIRDLTLPTIMRMVGRRDSLRWMYDYRIEW
ncbi:2-polyprenyl-6-methoxyphenol hydroxylase [Rhodococcus jostii]|uniref:2-polyprenyl-6-methoxyphenol hydroxylase n=2 Tax=Rhodococcus jostii TaxID=132919 RepID=A0A1H5I6R8_RHOJO|nr:2-polyprenyl-6-methoxyphenol hydroxylase [Rhodococcus jostii]